MVVHVFAVHPFRQQIDDRAPSGAVDAGNRDEQRNVAFNALTLRLKEAHAQFRSRFPEFLVAAAPAQYDGFKHTNLAVVVM